MPTNYLVCYDITEDDVRFTVADHCKDAGLVRIQYSVFFGMLQRSQLNSLRMKLRQSIEKANADIHIIKVCQQCERDHQVLSAINTDLLKTETTTSDYKEISEEITDNVMIL